jgi:Kef-type K+ transport system membrane component KefB
MRSSETPPHLEPLPAFSLSWRAGAAYAAMLLLAGALFFLIRYVGEATFAPTAPVAIATESASSTGRTPHVNVILHVLATLTAIMVLGYVLGRVLVRFGQPPVIGEVLAGIMLGPSLLGAISPAAMELLIPGRAADPHGHVVTALQAIAQLGIILYMFLVGLELNAAKLRRHAGAAVAISHASIVVPFVLGAALALWLYPIVSHQGVSFTSFALFMGVAMAVTAFPVLARILTDQQLQKTDLGVIALSCAAADDVTAWWLLALVVGVVQAQVETAIYVAMGAFAFVSAMFLVVRPLASAAAHRLEGRELPIYVVPAVLAAVLLSSLATEAIGIHAVFGAFLLGAVIPHDSQIARAFSEKLRDVVTVLLLPAFFAVTGMRTEIGLLADWNSWFLCAAIIFVATLGKLGGTVAAARFVGQDWRMATALGMLMNTRGLMGLIVLTIGLELGVISPTLFSMMVIMALVTTMMTAPVVRWLHPVS